MKDISFVSLFHFILFSNLYGIALVSNLRDKIIPYLDVFCPGANVCKEYRPGFVPEENIEHPLIHCCADCSCADDCHLRGDCCFPYEQTALSCEITRLPLPSKPLRPLAPGFRMVTQPPPTGCVTDPDSSSRHQMIQQPPWGDLYPVTSLSTQQIYKNQSIAECHNVFDGILWHVNMSCETSFVLKDMISFFETFDATNSKSKCSLEFVYPGDSKDIGHKKCAPYSNGSCPNSFFPIPDNLNLTRSDYIELCESNFQSLLLDTKVQVYKNTFCHTCNGHFQTEMICKKEIGRLTNTAFSVLLNNKFAQNPIGLKDQTRDAKETMACLSFDLKQDECRIVHCPSFQIPDENGDCIPQWDTISVTSFEINIKLIPEAVIPIEQWFINVTNPNYLMVSPWDSPWRITALYREMSKRNGIFYAALKALTETSTTTFLKKTSESLNKPWTLHFNEHHIQIQQTFRGFSINSNLNALMVSRKDEKGGEIVIEPLELLYIEHEQTKRKQFSIFVTPLFFCKQVNLKSHEYIVDRNNILTYNMTNLTLFEPEYAYDSSDGNLRICLEDSGFVALESSSSMVCEKCLITGYVCMTIFVFI